jgi:hypothetical protein
MFRVSLIDNATPQLQRVQKFAREYPFLAVDSVLDNIVPQVERLVDQNLRRVVPGPAKKPIQWTSEKQRRAFFATDGFGHGIPYKRTGRLPLAWGVSTRSDASGITVSVVNNSPAAPFVYGRWKQQFHTNTGWPDARPIIDRIADETRPMVFADQVVLARRSLRSYLQRGRALVTRGRR